MEQKDVNAALAVYVDQGNPAPWQEVIEAIRAGGVIVEATSGMLKIQAVPRPAVGKLARRLRELREASGVSQRELASALGVSTSAVIRHLQGQVLPQWATVSVLVQTMGGDPADYRADYDAARAEQQSRRRSS